MERAEESREWRKKAKRKQRKAKKRSRERQRQKREYLSWQQKNRIE